MCTKGAIDRFEGDWAVVELENGEIVDMPMGVLPPDVEEGSIIYIDEDGRINVSLQETDEQSNRVRKLMDKLFED